MFFLQTALSARKGVNFLFFYFLFSLFKKEEITKKASKKIRTVGNTKQERARLETGIKTGRHVREQPETYIESFLALC